MHCIGRFNSFYQSVFGIHVSITVVAMNDRIIRKYNTWRPQTFFCDACGAPAIYHLEHCGECGASFIHMHSLIKSNNHGESKHFTAPFIRRKTSTSRQSYRGDLQGKHS